MSCKLYIIRNIILCEELLIYLVKNVMISITFPLFLHTCKAVLKNFKNLMIYNLRGTTNNQTTKFLTDTIICNRKSIIISWQNL